MDDIAIVLAADDNYAQHAAVTAASILLHTNEPQRGTLYILSDGISEIKQKRNEEKKKELKRRLCQYFDTIFFYVQSPDFVIGSPAKP